MYCPSGHGQLLRGTRNWVCEECGHKVPIQPTSPEVSSQLPQIIDALPQLPSLLALPLRDFLEEPHPTQRLHRLCDAGEIVTRFCTVVLLGEVRRRTPNGALPTALLNRIRPHIERPTFGQWRDMLSSFQVSLRNADDLVVPEVQDFVRQHLLPLLRTGKEADHSLVTLRNHVAHSGAMSTASATHYLNIWTPRITHLVEQLAFSRHFRVCFITSGQAWTLVGASTRIGEPMPLDLSRTTLSSLESHTVLLRDNSVLDLWPLCEYGGVTPPSEGNTPQTPEDSPLLYLRTETRRILYGALGVDAPYAERFAALEDFRKLFSLNSQSPRLRHLPTDFEAELRQDAQAMIGRTKEHCRIKKIVKETLDGVLWIWGRGGLGKSFLLAKVATDLLGNPRQILRIAWRFNAGDQRRCNRLAFFRHAVERLAAWLQCQDSTIPDDPRELWNRLHSLLQEVATPPDNASRKDSRRVVIVVDGMDEIHLLDPDFSHVPFELHHKKVLWVCAGRAEGTLPRTFSPKRCVHVFPKGLPPMSTNDVRGMLLDGSGALKYKLVERDRETADTTGKPVILNPAVQAVLERANGLPLYVHFVVSYWG